MTLKNKFKIESMITLVNFCSLKNDSITNEHVPRALACYQNFVSFMKNLLKKFTLNRVFLLSFLPKLNFARMILRKN